MELSIYVAVSGILSTIPLTKISAAQDEVELSYHTVRGLYFLAVIFAASTYVYTADRPR